MTTNQMNVILNYTEKFITSLRLKEIKKVIFISLFTNDMKCYIAEKDKKRLDKLLFPDYC